jgi:hypothetical protein
MTRAMLEMREMLGTLVYLTMQATQAMPAMRGTPAMPVTCARA